MKNIFKKLIGCAPTALLAAALTWSFAGCNVTPQQQQAIVQTAQAIRASTASAGVGSASVSQSTRGIANSTAGPAIHATGRRAPVIKNARPYGGGKGLPLVSALSQKRFSQSASISKAVSGFMRAARSAPARVATAVPLTSYPCTDGGTMAINGEVDSSVTPNTYKANISFTDCKDLDMRDNGVMILSGSDNPTNNAMVFTAMDGAAFSGGVNGNGVYSAVTGIHATDFFTMNYTVLTGTLSSNATFDFSGTINDVGAAGWDMTFTANGTMTYKDYLDAGQSYSVTFTNFVEHDIMPGYLVTAYPMTYTSTINGTMAESWTTSGTLHTLSMTFTNYVLTEIDNNTYTTTAMSGGLTIASNQASNCDGGGTFTFTTQTPVRYDFGAINHTTAGRVTTVATISGTTATIVTVWNANGSLTVTIDGQTVNFNNESEFQNGCHFGDMNTNNTNTTTSVSGTPVTTTAGTMTATMIWQDPAATSVAGTDVDMDLHLVYYDVQAPTSITPLTTEINWLNPGSGFSATLGASAYTGILDYDMCAAGCSVPLAVVQGPEHITLTGMPPGYYILSANAFAINAPSTSADVTVTLQIGSNIYTFPVTNLAQADFFGTNPAAWFRVTDMVVDGTGAVTIMAPDTTLMPVRNINRSGVTKTKK